MSRKLKVNDLVQYEDKVAIITEITNDPFFGEPTVTVWYNALKSKNNGLELPSYKGSWKEVKVSALARFDKRKLKSYQTKLNEIKLNVEDDEQKLGQAIRRTCDPNFVTLYLYGYIN